VEPNASASRPGVRRRARGWLALAAGLFLLVLVRAADPFGDRGMTNVVSGMIVVLFALGTLVAFARRRSVPARVRVRVVAGVAAAVALLAVLVRVEGVSADMRPELAWRFGGSSDVAPLAARGELALAPASADDFPGFLGARRDNRVEGVALATDWDARPPRLRWRHPIGTGWAAFAVVGGHAFTLEQDARGQHATARELANGTVVWSTRIEDPFAHVLGGDGPRATPTVAGGRVFVQGAWGTLACLDASTGAVLWARDLVAELGSTRELEVERAQYGRSSSPLVAGGLVIAPGGLSSSGERDERGAGLVAFDAASGDLRWRSPPRNFSYASPALGTLGGIEQVLVVNEDTLSGHALADGRLLWEHPWPGTTSGDASVSQAIALPGDRVFVSKGYGVGGALLALDSPGDDFLVPRVVWHDERILRTKLTNVALHDGHVYALDEGTLECVELATGTKRWKEGRYGHGQLLLAGAHLLVCSEDGAVSLVAPSPERANAVLGSFQALEGKCWAHLALAGGLLLLRNAEECAAWELPLAD
jgi:outer membrane protein assembly factor BamB